MFDTITKYGCSKCGSQDVELRTRLNTGNYVESCFVCRTCGHESGKTQQEPYTQTYTYGGYLEF